PVAPVRVVAQCDHVGPRAQQAVGEFWSDAGAVGDVLAVDDADVGLELLPQPGQSRLDRVAAGDAEDVSEKEKVQNSAQDEALCRRDALCGTFAASSVALIAAAIKAPCVLATAPPIAPRRRSVILGRVLSSTRVTRQDAASPTRGCPSRSCSARAPAARFARGSRPCRAESRRSRHSSRPRATGL